MPNVFLAYRCAERLRLLANLLGHQLLLTKSLIYLLLAKLFVGRAPLLSNLVADRYRLFGHLIVIGTH